MTDSLNQIHIDTRPFLAMLAPTRPPPLPTTVPTAPPAEYILDPSRDLTLVVGGPSIASEIYHIFVSSAVLRLASPVWNAMLDPQRAWKESTAKVIPLPEDDPEALLLLLRIAHLQFGAIPPTCSFDMLLKLAVLCDKYDLAGLVRPYLEGWVNGQRHTMNQEGKEGWLFIAWTFGLTDTFTEVSKQLVLSMKRDEKGALVTAEGQPLEAGVIMPVDAIESINTVRENTLQAMEEICMEYIDRFSPDNPNPLCKNSTPHCDATVFGSLIQGLRLYLPLMGPPPSPCIDLSISHFGQRLNNLQVYTFPQTYTIPLLDSRTGRRDYTYYSAHTSCNLGDEMKRRIAGILAEVPSAVLDDHRNHMKGQREKCGVLEKNGDV